MTFVPDVDLHYDEDAFRWLHTDDPAAAGWVVTSVRPSSSEDVASVSPGPWLPGAGYQRPVTAWPVGNPGDDWCHLEIRDGQQVHAIGDCPHTE